MLNRTLIVLFVLLAFSSHATAQIGAPSTKCYIYLTANDLGVDLGAPVPPWAELVLENTLPGMGGMTLFRIRRSTCPCPCPGCCPSGGSGAAGGPTGPGGRATAGKPVCLDTGNTYITQTDVTVAGLGGGLNLTRRWNSLWPTDQAVYSVGLFGPNWRSTYEERIYVGSDYFIKYSRSDGSFWSFGVGGGGWMPAAPANVFATLVQNGSSWILTFQNGEKRQFSFASGLLTQITDRNGNSTQLSYDSSNRLVTVTSATGQHLYFNYASGSSLLVTSVTSDFGVTVAYQYDAQGRLSQVTKPDLTTENFTYNSQSQITAVTDQNGKILEAHSYDASGRGLTSSQADGVNALSVAYPQ